MDYLENSLSGITLPGHKIFREYLLEHGKMSDFSYSLEQFEHELRTYSLRDDDANKVVTFFQEFMSSLETKKLNIRTPKDEPSECPFCSFKGKKFPNVYIKFKLGFLVFRSYVTLGAKTNSNYIHINLEDFQGSQVYHAWEKTIRNLGVNASKELKDRIKKEQDDIQRLWFEAETSEESERGAYRPSLDEIISRTLVVADVVQKSYLATQNLPKLYGEELDTLSKRLLETT